MRAAPITVDFYLQMGYKLFDPSVCTPDGKEYYEEHCLHDLDGTTALRLKIPKNYHNFVQPCLDMLQKKAVFSWRTAGRSPCAMKHAPFCFPGREEGHMIGPPGPHEPLPTHLCTDRVLLSRMCTFPGSYRLCPRTSLVCPLFLQWVPWDCSLRCASGLPSAPAHILSTLLPKGCSPAQTKPLHAHKLKHSLVQSIRDNDTMACTA